MDEVLGKLVSHAGVRGVFVARYDGRLAGSRTSAEVNADAVSAAVPYLVRIFGAAFRSGVKSSAFDLAFADGRVIAADMAGACLLLLCDLRVEMSRLRMALNVAAGDLKVNAELAAEVPGLGAAPPPADGAGVSGPAAEILAQWQGI